ncbi:MAG: hypothetical protein V4632_24050, partial [Pseudomonadota bacterium]
PFVDAVRVSPRRRVLFCFAKKGTKKGDPYKAPCGFPKDWWPKREVKRTRCAQTCFTSDPFWPPVLRRFAKGEFKGNCNCNCNGGTAPSPY